MGERKGQNHYYPPDYDPNKGGLNKFLGTHALRERARKLHLGILIIRFEMPYNIWCDGCGQHVGMGVRYNAEKTKVGMYYSTPVYQFKMKCTMCDNHYVIKTDPGNLDYVIVSGARRQENRWDPTTNGQVVADDKDVQKRLFDDAMFKLEHGERDKGHAKAVGPVLGRLEAMREERWKDDYSANCALRAKFRMKRRELKEKDEQDVALLARSSLAIELQPESEEDKKLAHLLSLAPARSLNERKQNTRDEIISRPALPSCLGNATTFMGVRASKQLARSLDRETLGIVGKKQRTQTNGPSMRTDKPSTDSNETSTQTHGLLTRTNKLSTDWNETSTQTNGLLTQTYGHSTQTKDIIGSKPETITNGLFAIQQSDTDAHTVDDSERSTECPRVSTDDVRPLFSLSCEPPEESTKETCVNGINNKSLVCVDYDCSSSDDGS